MKEELIEAHMYEELERCELAIRQAWDVGMRASIVIVRELNTIRDRELYRAAKCETFNQYLEERMDPRSFRRQVAVEEVIDTIQEAQLPLPDNESQAVELARLSREARVTFWKKMVEKFQQGNQLLTIRLLRDAVDKELKDHRPGVRTALDIEGNGAGTIRLSEEGERALDRIRRLCGNPIADSIVRMTIVISERDLKKWAEQDDELVERLGYYIGGLRWSLAKAIAFENRDLNGSTSLDDMLTLASARSGLLTFKYQKAKVTVELAA